MKVIKAYFDDRYNNTFAPTTDISFVIASPGIWADLQPHLKDAQHVLDVGCGGGTLLYNLTKSTSGQVYGIDISQVACAMARSFAPLAHVFCGDFQQSGFPTEGFDIVISTMTIEHCDDVAFIREARRILKPGGKLLITTVLKGRHAWYYCRNMKGEITLEPSHLREYRHPNELTTLLKLMGFNILRIETPRITFSPLDFFFIRLFALFHSDFMGRLPVTPPLLHLRRVTRVPIPGYRALEVLAEKREPPLNISQVTAAMAGRPP